MTAIDFAELKRVLTKLDDVAANEYLTRYMEGFYDEPTYQEYGEYVHTKSSAIITELIEILQSQSEVIERTAKEMHSLANKDYDPDYTDLYIDAEQSLSETNTRLQKLREGK